MTIDNTGSLPENIFEKRITRPTHQCANSQGKVLWFSPTLGWSEGNWQYPPFADISHWTYAPEHPSIEEDPKGVRDRAFEAWLQSFPSEMPAAAQALAKLGWNAAWDRR
jgi:hypothetical protein